MARPATIFGKSSNILFVLRLMEIVYTSNLGYFILKLTAESTIYTGDILKGMNSRLFDDNSG